MKRSFGAEEVRSGERGHGDGTQGNPVEGLDVEQGSSERDGGYLKCLGEFSVLFCLRQSLM